jgi:hypothetical protein
LVSLLSLRVVDDVGDDTGDDGVGVESLRRFFSLWVEVDEDKASPADLLLDACDDDEDDVDADTNDEVVGGEEDGEDEDKVIGV